MLDSLEIQNYRNFKHLRIEKLGRVNLIIGKNNTGKTSLLEAVSILVKQEDLDLLLNILENRREHFSSEDLKPSQIASDISNLFYQRKAAFDEHNAIKINTISEEITKSSQIRMIKYREESMTSEIGIPEQYSEMLSQIYTRTVEVTEMHDGKIGINFSTNGVNKIISLTRESISDMFSELSRGSERKKILQFIPTQILDDTYIFNLWQDIQLTDSEDDIINALKLLEPDIQRLSFARKNDTDYVIIKLKNISNPVPLRSMGDGINRILTIILSMVNCKGGYLLIDEFDNGLHVSVQKQLWEIVFELANKLNIQVFATTHSNDCINAFQVIANSQPDYENAMLIKLVNKKGGVSAILADAKELHETVEELLIDLR
jgi:AAA15 family ATPase/GTPase